MSKRIGPEMFDEMSNKTQADVEQEVAKGIAEPIPIITGGYKSGAVPGLGPEVLVELMDTLDPSGNAGYVPVGFFSKTVGEWNKKVPLNKPFLIPEKIVRYLEERCVETNRRRIDPSSSMFGNKGLAEATNPGMKFVMDADGECWLERKFRRYIVRRVGPQEMRA